jgi:spore germination protein KB
VDCLSRCNTDKQQRFDFVLAHLQQTKHPLVSGSVVKANKQVVCLMKSIITEKLQISNLQIFMMMIAATVSYGHFVYVHFAFISAGRDTWLTLFPGFLVGIGIVFFQCKLITKQPRQSLIQSTMTIFGKWFGMVVSGIYILFFILVAGLTIKELASFLGLIYPTTPMPVFVLSELLLAAWVLRAGAEVIARAVQLLLPGLMILGLTAATLSIPDKDISNLLPILDHGPGSLAKGALVFIVMFAELIVFGMFIQDANDLHRIPKHSLLAGIILFIMFVGPATGPIMVFGESIAQTMAYPTYSEIQYIRLAGIFERVDIVGVLLWSIGSFLRVSVFLYGASRGMAHLFNAKKENIYALPTALLAGAFTICVLPISREAAHNFVLNTFPVIAIFVGVVLPTITVVVMMFRQNSGQGKEQRKKSQRQGRQPTNA